MFKLALLSDIHGNLTSLERVLAELQAEVPDRIVCLGDVAAMGSDPQAVIQRLRTIEADYVMGNTDEFLLEPPPPDFDPSAMGWVEAVERWGAKQIDDRDLAFLRTFQPTVSLDLSPQLSFLGFHGSPRSNLEGVDSLTPARELGEIFADTSQVVLAGGHTHVQMLRRFQDRTIINPGSVGLPHETEASGETYNPGRAEYAILRADGENLSIDLRRVPIEVDLIKRKILDSDMPYATQMAAAWRA